MKPNKTRTLVTILAACILAGCSDSAKSGEQVASKSTASVEQPPVTTPSATTPSATTPSASTPSASTPSTTIATATTPSPAAEPGSPDPGAAPPPGATIKLVAPDAEQVEEASETPTAEGLETVPIGPGRREPPPPPPSGPPIPAPATVAAPPASATKTPSGLAFEVLQKGSGSRHPAPTDLITVHYTGWLSSDGKQLDSSVQRGTPLTAALDKMMGGWREGVANMVVGEKRRLWIPETLAFEGNPSAPKGMIVYDVELLDFRTGPAVAPSDVAAPPAEATRTPTGLVWKVLQAGSGTKRPGPKTRVKIHYTGWDPGGKMVDSSVARGAPVDITLGTGIAGWTEALQSMVEGDRRRVWVPARLAFAGKTGRPQTDLVYDLELIQILD